MRRLIIVSSVATIVTTTAALPAVAAEPERRRGQYTSQYNEPKVSASMDQDKASAGLRSASGKAPSGPPSGRTLDTTPQRPTECFYIPQGTSVTPAGVTSLTYAQVRQWFKPGDRFGYTCHYLDDPGNWWSGEFVLGEEPPETVGARQAEAQAALNRWVEQGFPSPVVTGKPTLLDQRIAIATWFAVPTLTQVETAGQADLTLTARARPLVTFNVPVGRWGTETFECTASSVGPDGRPLDDTCSHAFQHATAGPTTATVTIAFDVTYSSTITGEVDVPVGPGSVTRTSQIPMQVKEIQAVGR